MNNERLMTVLVAPHNTEKAARVADGANQFTFKVATDASKREIAAAVEMMFEVKVTDVRTVNVKGKRKRFGMMQGKRKDWKKAYVTLAEGNDINFAAE